MSPPPVTIKGPTGRASPMIANRADVVLPIDVDVCASVHAIADVHSIANVWAVGNIRSL